MVHTPVHASWLIQIEIYFSIVQRKALSPNDFTGVDAIIDRLNAFEAWYNQTARPCELLTRLEHNPIQPRAA